MNACGRWTANVPKPMVAVAGKPIMQHQVDWYQAQGVDSLCYFVRLLARSD